MDEVVGAIADPVRRKILVMLRDVRLSAGEIAARFMISRPAVSRHLRVLRQSGLVH
ncbi:MAG: metalloregulator ArsR/SmtB family transcription factor, partial [Pseudonocardiaceae bacterium]